MPVRGDFKSKEGSPAAAQGKREGISLGKLVPLFSLPISHPSAVCPPLQTALTIPPFSQSRLADLVQKSLVWVFLRR